MKLTVTMFPKFNAQLIYQEVVGAQWIKFQNLVEILGHHLLGYLQTYINARSHTNRTIGNLAKSMELEVLAEAGTASIGWGIGKIATLDMLAPYWYIINYGGSSWKGDYHFVGGEFVGNKFEYMPYSGKGAMLPSGIKGTIIPMNYIEATRFQLDAEINIILQSLKGGTKTGRSHGWGGGAGGAK